jgi:hypothetical protein
VVALSPGQCVRADAERNWESDRTQLAQMLAADPEVTLLELAQAVGLLDETAPDGAQRAQIRAILENLSGTADEARIRAGVKAALDAGTHPAWICDLGTPPPAVQCPEVGEPGPGGVPITIVAA